MQGGSFYHRLQKLPEPIRIGIVGAGAMGKGLLYQSRSTPGIQCVSLADIRLEKAIACAREMQMPYRVVSTSGEMSDAVRRGELAICDDGGLVAESSEAGVMIEASSAIAEAGLFCVAALQTGKHVVMMNAEADLIFGPHLSRLARQHDLVYTSCDGDQHGVLMRLVGDVRLWGFDLVMAGNIKGFLDRESNPTRIVPEADRRKLDYRMATAYTDGTKLCIEMALVANALGLRTCAPGMYGPPAAHVREALQLFDFERLWSGRRPFVDYLLGVEPGGGVFVVEYCEHPYQREMLAYYKMGAGPFYLFYRPYHLCHVEAMQCVSEAALDGRALLQPACGFRTNVFAYAKRGLRDGDMLDGLGGYDCYGLIDNCQRGKQHDGLPVCLAGGLVLECDIPKDAPILLRHVRVPRDRADFSLHALARAAES